MRSKDNNLEKDLWRSDLILEKVKKDSYAQNLYAAMCNMRWQKTEVFPILKEEYWHVSWRGAGGLVADLRGQGDYMDWYCSGMGGFAPLADETPEETDRWMKEKGYVPESVVTDEIKKDLAGLGWHPVPWDENKDNI